MPSARSNVRLNRPGASIHANHNPDNTISFNHTTALSKQLKSDLVRLARHFRLRHQSKTVPELRTMLKEHLDKNRNRLATSNRYGRLYAQPKGTQPPQDEQHVGNDGDEWRGISDRSNENESEDENPDEPRQRLGRVPSSRFSSSSRHISSDMSTRYAQIDRDPGENDRDHARHWPRRRDDRQPKPLLNGSNQRYSRIVPGTMAVGAGYAIPDTVRKSMSAGWKHHISLRLLTDAHCIYTHSIAKPDGFYFDTTTGKFTISSVDRQISAKDEEDLSFDEWHQAWRRFLTLLREFFPGDHPYWRAHFENILNAPTRAEHWYLWLAYDIEIRRRSISEPIDPSIHHASVWRDLEPRYQRKVAEELMRQLLTQQFDDGLWTTPLEPIEETGF